MPAARLNGGLAMTSLFQLPILLVVLGQAAAADDAKDATESATRLEHMKGLVGAWAVHPADDPNIRFRLQAEPVLRFTNPVGQSLDGTVFLWTGPEGRPVAVVQASLNRRGFWAQELSSLSEGRLVAEAERNQAWRPGQGGVEFRPIPDAPKPASTPEQRLGQMRALAREFTVEDDFQRKSFQKLRLLPTPFARYGKPGTAVADGVLFCFVLTTDPEAYLILEAREGKAGPEWHYAFAPSTTYPLRASRKGVILWGKNLDRPEMGPNDTLYQMHTTNSP
jgi:hypothetical protein